jgi:hypothetical protein
MILIESVLFRVLAMSIIVLDIHNPLSKLLSAFYIVLSCRKKSSPVQEIGISFGLSKSIILQLTLVLDIHFSC